MTTTETTTFALRTEDTAWIARHHGVTGAHGRTLVQVPEVERITLGGRPALRCTFADIPADALSATIVCPAAWAEAPEVTAQRPAAPDGRALFLARMRGEGLTP